MSIFGLYILLQVGELLAHFSLSRIQANSLPSKALITAVETTLYVNECVVQSLVHST